METGYDIIFFWVARMMMLGIELTGREPFHTISLSGLIRDPYGQKMSKTKGNVVDPLAVMAESGADALRFALIHGATPGQDQRFGPQKLELARNFANKLWNAARFVLGARPASVAADARTAGGDRRRAPRADRALDPVARGRDDGGGRPRLRRVPVRRDHPRPPRRHLVGVLRLGDRAREGPPRRRRPFRPDQRAATWWTLVDALDTYLRLLHPVMPFVTEAIWGSLPRRAGDAELLIVARWPAASASRTTRWTGGWAWSSRRSSRSGTPARRPVSRRETGSRPISPSPARSARASRRWRPPSAGWRAPGRWPSTRRADDAAGRRRIPGARSSRRATSRAGSCSRQPPRRRTGERARLEKELAEAEGHLAAARARLANPAFVDRAPAAVVDGARTREAELASQVERLRERLA